MKAVFLSGVFLCALSIPPSSTAGPGQEVHAQAGSPIHHEVLRGIELLYNWEFEKSEVLFRKIILERPEDPMGHFYLAMVAWSRLASGFWTKDVVDEYGRRIDATISVSKGRIEKGKGDAYTYLYLGGALGFKGRFQLMEHKYVSSFFLALEAVDALKTSLKMDPDNKDVLFGLGIFDYYTARLSGVLKFLSYLLIHKGDKEEGIRKLRVAAHGAPYSSIEAKSLLAHIYLFMEGDYQKAFPLCRELSRRFPDNARFLYFEGLANVRLDKEEGYREILNSLRAGGMGEKTALKVSLWANQALYLEATYHLYRGEYEAARARLDTILGKPDPAHDPSMVAWPVVKKGLSYDLSGDRDKAMEYYRKVLDMENGAGAQFLAERFMAVQPKKGDPLIGY